jgi:hypothetical protein
LVKPSLIVFKRVKQGGAGCSNEPSIIDVFLVIEKQDNLGSQERFLWLIQNG